MRRRPAAGPSTTIYNRFNRWSRRGLWQRLFEALVKTGRQRHADDRQHNGQGPSLCRGRKRRTLAQAIGRSRGGRTTKIHAVVDCLGRLIAFEITPGQLGDVRVAEALLAPTLAARLCIADTAYDSDALPQRCATPLPERARHPARDPKQSDPQGTSIPSTAPPTSSAISLNACSTGSRTGVALLLATKLAANFAATVAIATIILWWIRLSL
jgi:transposase